jgi:hypothetical protein
VLEEMQEMQAILQRVAALAVGKAELTCCLRVPVRASPASGCRRCGPTRG